MTKAGLALLTLAMAACNTAWATTLDGEWRGTFQCVASPTDAAKIPAFSSAFTLSLSGTEAAGSRVAPNVTEVLKGTLQADGSLQVSGVGQRKSGQGKPWVTTITGTFTADKFAGSGGMYANDGSQLRDCTVSLYHVGTAGPTASGVDATIQSTIPRHLQLARELVATVKPENNRYNFVNRPTGVHWKGDVFRSENSVDTMCVGLVTDVLEKAESPAFKELKSKVNWRKQVWGRDFVEAMKQGYGFSQIKKIDEVEPGDIYILRCAPDLGCSAQGAPAEGHVAFVDVKPFKQASKRPFVAGTTQWVVTLIDSDLGPHDPEDTRRTLPGAPKITGVGRGSVRIYTNDDGAQVGYSNGWGTKYIPVDRAWVFFARPKY